MGTDTQTDRQIDRQIDRQTQSHLRIVVVVMPDALNAVDVVPDGLPERCGVHVPLSANSDGVERGRGEGGREGREGRDESEPRKGRRGG